MTNVSKIDSSHDAAFAAAGKAYDLPIDLLKAAAEQDVKNGQTPAIDDDEAKKIAKERGIKGDLNTPENQWQIYIFYLAEQTTIYFNMGAEKLGNNLDPSPSALDEVFKRPPANNAPSNNYTNQPPINRSSGSPFVPSPRLIAMTKQFEGFQPVAVQQSIDRLGVISVGYGHTNLAPNDRDAAVPGKPITPEKATEILIRDMTNFGAAVAKRWPGLLELPPSMQDAFVSYAYGTGVNALMNLHAVQLAKEARNPDGSFNRQKLAESAAALEQGATKAKGVVLRGLVNKRKAEARLAAMDLDGVNATPEIASAPRTGSVGKPIEMSHNASSAGRIAVGANNQGATANQQLALPQPKQPFALLPEPKLPTG